MQAQVPPSLSETRVRALPLFLDTPLQRDE